MRSRLMFSWTLLSLLLALFAALPQSALALTASQVYKQVKDSVVVIRAYDQMGKPVGLGSGVVLPSGDIITNYHVVKAGVRYAVGQGKHVAPATLKAVNSAKDLCLFNAPGLVAKPVRLGKTAKLKIGDPVYAVGAPQGLELSLSAGIVSQLRGGPSPIIQTTVAISPGSSGGGLFNAKGELVGITTFYLNEGQGLNFALPVEWITEVARRETPKHRDSTPKPGANLRTMWEDRITALEKAKDWQGMLAWCRRWTRVEPDNAEPWGILGLAYLQLDRYRDAIEANREALRIKPDNAEAWNNLALAYLLSGNRSAALEAVRELRRYNPKGADKLFNLIIKP